MDIAGSDWDLSVSIQENLVNGGSEVSDYSCPTSEGHFPDTEKCNVYYQCALASDNWFMLIKADRVYAHFLKVHSRKNGHFQSTRLSLSFAK